MLEIASSRSGSPTGRVKGMWLHSPYDPAAEAERFVRESVGAENPGTILLLGEGLGYTHRALRQAFPGARVIAVFYAREVYSRCFQPPEASWYPGHDLPLMEFLRLHLQELDLEGLKLLEWQPSSKIYPEVARQAGQAAAQLCRELRGSLVTTLSLGRLWFKNSLLNFLGIEETLQAAPAVEERPILIAASGPSLPRCLEVLRRYRDRLLLWALPSAVLFLAAEDLCPDLVLLTDPGFYAISHLHPAAGLGFILAMPLSAAVGSWRVAAGVRLISQETPCERALLSGAGLAAARVLPQGTVAASALELALGATAGPVVLAGLDLCYEDILSHVRPNAFERLLGQEENRFSPLYSLLFRRAQHFAPVLQSADGGTDRRSLSLQTYAGWFSFLPAGLKKRVSRLNPSSVTLEGIRGKDNRQLARSLERLKPGRRGQPFIADSRYPEGKKRKQVALGLLERWREGILRLRAEIRKRSSLEPLLGDPGQLELAFYLEAASLTEMKRTLRLRGPQAALEQALSTLEREQSFLELLLAKVG